MRLELTRSCDHYPLKVACIPISPPALGVPRTGLEPAHLAACAPETHASTNSAIWAKKKSGKRDSNSRPQPWQGCALPTELFPHAIKQLLSDLDAYPINNVFKTFFLQLLRIASAKILLFHETAKQLEEKIIRLCMYWQTIHYNIRQ